MSHKKFSFAQLTLEEQIDLKSNLDQVSITSAPQASSITVQQLPSVLQESLHTTVQPDHLHKIIKSSTSTAQARQYDFQQLCTIATRYKAVQSITQQPPLFYGVPGVDKYMTQLDTTYTGVINPDRVFLASSLLAMVVSRTLLSPLQRVKTLMQVHPVKQNGAPSPYASLSSTWSHLRSQETSLKGLLRGNTANLFEGVMKYVVLSQGYVYLRTLQDSTSSWRDAFYAGALASLGAHFVCYPIQVIRSRMYVHDRSRFPSVSQSAVRISIQEGYGGLYRGMQTSFLGYLAYIGLDSLWHSKIHTSESISAAQHNMLRTPGVDWLQTDPINMKAAAGGVAGLWAIQTALYPLDVVRKRLQVAERTLPHYQSAFSALDYIKRTEGWKGLFRGYSAHMCLAIPSVLLMHKIVSWSVDGMDSLNRLFDEYFRRQRLGMGWPPAPGEFDHPQLKN